eukprot:905657-Rhodomonas_salina.1
MRTLGLRLPEMCKTSTTLTIAGMIMGIIDIVIGLAIVAIYATKAYRSGGWAALFPTAAQFVQGREQEVPMPASNTMDGPNVKASFVEGGTNNAQV